MKCRAKMIDGQPVTFEFIDHGVNSADGSMLSEMTGEGFYVRSVTSFSRGVHYRVENDRAALEKSGVDTSTWEYEQAWYRDKDDNLLTRPTSYWAPLCDPDPPKRKGSCVYVPSLPADGGPWEVSVSRFDGSLLAHSPTGILCLMTDPKSILSSSWWERMA